MERTFASTTEVLTNITGSTESTDAQNTIAILSYVAADSTLKNKVSLESELIPTQALSSINNVANSVPQLLTKKETVTSTESPFFTVPFFSQLTDITEASWKKVGCGITGLAMLIEYYYPGEVDSVDTLLHEGVALGAYDNSVGWSYSGLISVAQKYGVTGTTHDYKSSTMDDAFAAMKKDLADGPLMASVHYTFKPTNPIPHLVIISGIKNNLVYYNDPADTTGGGSISIEQFKSGWKKRYIEFYPIG